MSLTKIAQLDQRSLWDLVGSPLYKQWLGSHGMVQLSPGASAYDQILESRRQAGATEAASLADQGDVARRAKMFAGLSALMGVTPTAQRQGQYERMAKDVSVVAPFIAQLAPDLWSQLHGGNSAAPLAASIYRSGRDKITPAAAAAMAKEVANDLYDHPEDYRGFSSHEIGQIYDGLRQRGLASDISTPGVRDLLKQYTAPIRAARELYGYQAPIPEVIAGLGEGLHQMQPQDLARRINEQNAFRRYGGQHAAPFLETGITPGFGQGSVEQLAEQNRRLTTGAGQSPMAKQLAATMQMDEAGLLPEGSAAANLAEQIRSGQGGQLAMPAGRWLSMMEESGVSPSAAMSAIRSPEAGAYLDKYNIPQTVRGLQRETDVAPLMSSVIGDRASQSLLQHHRGGMAPQQVADRMQAAVPGMTPQQAFQAMNLASATSQRRFGMPLRQLQQLHSPQLAQTSRNLMGDVRSQATQRSNWARQFAHTQMPPLQRATSLLQDAAKPGTTISPGQAAKRMLNIVPASEIPKP